MIKLKKKSCKTCGKPSYIFSHGNCKYCDAKIRMEKDKMEKGTLLMQDKFFYLEIWKERPHVCVECGRKIELFSVDLFHHVLPKKLYPQFRHYKRNVIITCGVFGCHSKAESAVDYPKMKIYNHCESIKKELLATIGVNYFPLWRRQDYGGMMVWERDNPIIKEEKYH